MEARARIKRSSNEMAKLDRDNVGLDTAELLWGRANRQAYRLLIQQLYCAAADEMRPNAPMSGIVQERKLEC